MVSEIRILDAWLDTMEKTGSASHGEVRAMAFELKALRKERNAKQVGVTDAGMLVYYQNNIIKNHIPSPPRQPLANANPWNPAAGIVAEWYNIAKFMDTQKVGPTTVIYALSDGREYEVMRSR